MKNKRERVVTRRPGSKKPAPPTVGNETPRLTSKAKKAVIHAATGYLATEDAVIMARKSQTLAEQELEKKLKNLITDMATKALPIQAGYCFQLKGRSTRYDKPYINATVYDGTSWRRTGKVGIFIAAPTAHNVLFNGEEPTENIDKLIEQIEDCLEDKDRLKKLIGGYKPSQWPEGWHYPYASGIKRRLENIGLEGYALVEHGNTNIRKDGNLATLCERIRLQVRDKEDLRQQVEYVKKQKKLEEYLSDNKLLAEIVKSDSFIDFRLNMIAPKKVKKNEA